MALGPQWGIGPSSRFHFFFSPLVSLLFHGFLQEV